jgi:cytochrome c553
MKYNLRTTSFFKTTILLCLLGFSGASQAVRLSGTCPTGHAMDMSGKAMGSSDIKSGAQHAEAECSSCHGTDGNGVSESDDVPYLAGQDFMYLCAWLDTCRKQGKKCEGHEDLAAQLSDHDIVNLAMFYAHLPSIKW